MSDGAACHITGHTLKQHIKTDKLLQMPGIDKKVDRIKVPVTDSGI